MSSKKKLKQRQHVDDTCLMARDRRLRGRTNYLQFVCIMSCILLISESRVSYSHQDHHHQDQESVSDLSLLLLWWDFQSIISRSPSHRCSLCSLVWQPSCLYYLNVLLKVIEIVTVRVTHVTGSVDGARSRQIAVYFSQKATLDRHGSSARINLNFCDTFRNFCGLIPDLIRTNFHSWLLLAAGGQSVAILKWD